VYPKVSVPYIIFVLHTMRKVFMDLSHWYSSIVSTVHRGLLWDHYGYDNHDDKDVTPIIDSAYVLLDFAPRDDDVYAEQNPAEKGRNIPGNHKVQHSTIGCLELCMYAEGSRHQEEIIVTGMKGRLEGKVCL
jgi:hypothetical protein